MVKITLPQRVAGAERNTNQIQVKLWTLGIGLWTGFTLRPLRWCRGRHPA